jgi:hypothetical protein
MTSSHSRRRRVARGIVLAALSAAFAGFLAPSASAQSTDTFTGFCDLTGRVMGPAPANLEEIPSTLVAEGTCSGSLNGEQVSDAPVRASAQSDTTFAVLPVGSVPLVGSGTGRATFLGEGANIGFTFQQVAAAVLLQGNDGGGGVAIVQPLTEEQPENARQTNVRILAVAVGISG